MHSPANYGFVPRTLECDGDPADVLVLGQDPIVPLTLVDARAIGGFEMRDEEGVDTVCADLTREQAIEVLRRAAQCYR